MSALVPLQSRFSPSKSAAAVVRRTERMAQLRQARFGPACAARASLLRGTVVAVLARYTSVVGCRCNHDHRGPPHGVRANQDRPKGRSSSPPTTSARSTCAVRILLTLVASETEAMSWADSPGHLPGFRADLAYRPKVPAATASPGASARATSVDGGNAGALEDPRIHPTNATMRRTTARTGSLRGQSSAGVAPHAARLESNS
jgi:hypothetical protein